MKKRKSDKLTTVILIVCFLAGLSLLLYPSVSNLYISIRHSQVINDYSQQVDTMENETYERLFREAEEFNAALNRRGVLYPLPPELESAYRDMLDPSDMDILAYVEIPLIDVTLPIGHGTDDEVLQSCLGHLEWTSLPIGGESSHCVISGHRGLPAAELLTNIDRMEPGDIFYIHVLDKTLTYMVDNIAVVEPNDYQLLTVVEGKDYVTLLTCTPYGINSHRLLVRGTRVDTAEYESDSLYIPNEVSEISKVYLIPIGLVLVSAIVVIISLVGKLPAGLRTRKGANKHENEENRE